MFLKIKKENSELQVDLLLDIVIYLYHLSNNQKMNEGLSLHIFETSITTYNISTFINRFIIRTFPLISANKVLRFGKKIVLTHKGETTS